AQAALREVAADPRHLGALPGLLLVLHTWGQNLHHHPHVHVVVSGGGLACDRQGRAERPEQGLSCRAGVFLPGWVLSRVCRGKCLAGVRRLHEAGSLCVPASWSAADFAGWLDAAYRREWVVYARPPWGGAGVVLKYLARYVGRVALSNERLLATDGATVTFGWQDYAHGGKGRGGRGGGGGGRGAFCVAGVAGGRGGGW